MIAQPVGLISVALAVNYYQTSQIILKDILFGWWRIFSGQFYNGHFTKKIDGVGHFDNRDFTHELHHYVKKKYT